MTGGYEEEKATNYRVAFPLGLQNKSIYHWMDYEDEPHSELVPRLLLLLVADWPRTCPISSPAIHNAFVHGGGEWNIDIFLLRLLQFYSMRGEDRSWENIDDKNNFFSVLS